MEWIEKLNQAINYMEEHITEDMDYAKLGKIAGCSSYHFQRMFTYLAGVPLSEYVRRRRMSLAAVDIQNGDEKIIDVALKYKNHYEIYEKMGAHKAVVDGVEGVYFAVWAPNAQYVNVIGSCEDFEENQNKYCHRDC